MSRVEELEKQIQELQKKLKLEKQKTEIEYSFKNDEEYWVLWHDGYMRDYIWDGSDFDQARYSQGNTFKTKAEAERERDKRALLTRFRQFRDKCNGDWTPDFKDNNSQKNYISFNHNDNMMKIYSYSNLEEFNLFGYFKNGSDAKRAIELFGDEIIRLWVDE